MVCSNVIVDVTISHLSFVFSQSCAKVSAGFTNVSSLLAVPAFDLVCIFLSVLRFVIISLYPLVINVVSFISLVAIS